MDSPGLILALVAMVGMALQGGSCMLSERRPLSVGFLNCFLLLLTLFMTIFLCSGALVIAPEFGAVMVNGAGATWFLRFALVATGALPPLCTYRIRQLNHWPAHIWIRLLIGVAVGIWAATRLQLLNPDDLVALRVYSYDSWWPPLIVWLTVCLAETMLALAKIESKVTSLAFAAAIVAPMARFALMHQELSDPQSRVWWHFIEPVSLLLAIAFLAHAYLLPHITLAPERRWSIAGFVAGGVFGACLFGFQPGPVKLVLDLVPAIILFGGVVLALVGSIVYPEQHEGAEGQRSTREAVVRRAAADFSIHRLYGLFFATSLLVIPLVLTDIFSIGALDRDLELALLLFFWLGFSTRLAHGVFNTLPNLFRNGALYLPIAGKAWGAVSSALQRLRGAFSGAVKAVSSGSGWAITFRTIALTVFALLGLIAVGEMLNYHKLVVEPFEWKGGGEDKEKVTEEKVAERVSDGVVNALGTMRRELLPVLLYAPPSGTHSSAPRIQPAVLDNGAVQSAVAKSSDLKISNVSIPLAVLMDPIQRLVRWAFDIRVVGGSLYKDSSDRYVVLINSDSGETWKIPEKAASPQDATAPKVATETNAKTPPAVTAKTQPAPSAAPATREAAGQSSASRSDGPACDEEMEEADPLDEVIDQAAFDIASGDPSFIAMGLTKNWKAYGYFRAGLHHWNCYQSYSHWSDLESAIQFFRQAVQEDSTFAPAHYRLGLALQNTGEMDGAVQAFKDSVNANPELVQAQTAEAETLRSYDADYDTSPSYRPAIANYPQGNHRRYDERRLWAGVIALPPTPMNQLDQRSAYYGLCRDQFFLDNTGIDPFPNKFYLNYFYCSRAQALFFRLPLISREEVQQKRLEASILSMLGDILNYHDYKVKSYPLYVPSDDKSAPMVPTWFCSEEVVRVSAQPARGRDAGGADVDRGAGDASRDERGPKKVGYETHYVVRGSSLTAHAVRYYNQSLRLVPDDDYVLCAAASAEAYLARDPKSAAQTMTRLSQSSEAHSSLASLLAEKGTRLDHASYAGGDRDWTLAAIYYSRALYEYQSAIDQSPSDYDLLDSYAYTVWQWSLDARSENTLQPALVLKQTAEADAREAIRLATLRNDRDSVRDARDSLGEVLLAQGRNEEAIYQMRQAIKDATESYELDEFRWDLAQALVCSSADTTNAADRQKNDSEAVGLFAAIQKHESQHELRPFTNTPGAFDLELRRQRCFTPPDAKIYGPFDLSLSDVSYQSEAGCSAFTVVQAIYTGDPRPSAVWNLYIVGGDIYRSSDLSATVQLVPPLIGHRYYFAQLQDVASGVASPMITFDLPDDSGNAQCPHGHVTLNFK